MQLVLSMMRNGGWFGGLLSAGVVLSSAGLANGQAVWDVQVADMVLLGDLWADDWVATPPGIIDTDSCALGGAMIPGFGGYSFGNACGALAREKKHSPPQSVTSASSYGRSRVLGNGTPTIEIDWVNNVLLDAAAIDGFEAEGEQRLRVRVSMEIAGLAPGTPVTVYYSWDAHGAAYTEHEMGAEDPVETRDNALSLDGVDLIGGAMNFADPPGPSGFNELVDQTGMFNSTVGSTVEIDVNSFIFARMFIPGEGLYDGQDSTSAVFRGRIRLSLVGPLPPTPPGGITPGALAVFSVDIGGDTELSDANFGGNGAFDPGDLYPWFGPALPMCGADGVYDDKAIFAGADPFPTPPDCIPYLTAAPTCSGLMPFDPFLVQFFNLNGTDFTDFSLLHLAYGPGAPPIAAFNSSCVYPARHIILSYKDNGAMHYVGDPFAGSCEIPVTSSSPYLQRRYGTTAGQDEVVGIETIPMLLSPVLNAYPVLDEARLHVSLAPNPDLSENEDDDVNALDILSDPAVCDHWYFTCSHEAPHFDPMTGITLDPGAVYQVTAGGPVLVVHPVIHLGLLLGVDLDAIEFAFVENPNGGMSLALLFSVASDDPLTPIDESGGLDPRTIYASFLDGTHYEFLAVPRRDDIDAITVWSSSLSGLSNPPAPCPGDADGNGVVDQNDIAYVVLRLGNVGVPGTVDGDMDGDGDVDFDDITFVVLRLGACP